MAVEIERKFLVIGNDWRSLGSGKLYRQGYIASSQGRTVRVRIAGDRGFLTLKGPTVGIARSEFEYEIPLQDATELLDTLCDRPLIEKTRYKIPWQGLVWEVDEFAGDNQGLIVAEIELPNAHTAITPPAWIGQEVTQDDRYYNSNLAKHPYSQWSPA